MSSMADLLKEAFDKKDWGTVSIVYEQLTGKTLNDIENNTFNPRTNTQRPNQQAQTKSKLIVPNSAKGNIPIPGGQKGKPARPEAVDISKNSINLFVDDGTEAVEDKAIDAVLKNKNPIPRVRGSDTVDIPCNSCGNLFCVNVTLVSSKGYTCDSCITRKR